MAMDTLGTEAVNSTTQAGNYKPEDRELSDIAATIPQGLAKDSPMARAAFDDIAKQPGYFLGAPIAGAGVGAQAAQGQINPIAATLQGFAAGLQVPSQIYAAKRQQLQSVVDATPLSATLPELSQRYPELSGLPSKIALELIQKISLDAYEVRKTGQMELAKEQARLSTQMTTPDEAQKMARSLKTFGVDIDDDFFTGQTRDMAEKTFNQMLEHKKNVASKADKAVELINNRIKETNFLDVRTAYNQMDDYIKRVVGNDKSGKGLSDKEISDPGDEAFKAAFIKVTRPFFARPFEGEDGEALQEQFRNSIQKVFGSTPLTDKKRFEYYKEAKAAYKSMTDNLLADYANIRNGVADKESFDNAYPIELIVNPKSAVSLPEPKIANKKSEATGGVYSNPFMIKK